MTALNASIAYTPETTPGTAGSGTKLFVPFVSESLVTEYQRLESDSIIAGRRVIASEQWNGGPIVVSGDTAHELQTTGLLPLFKAMLGGYSGSGSDSPYTHTFTPGDLTGDATTISVNRPTIEGVDTVTDYLGCKVSSWEIACRAGEIATVGIDWVGMSSDAGSLGTVTYPVSRPLKFNHGSVEIGGAQVPVKSVTINGDNGLDTDRLFLGSQTIKEPVEAELREYTFGLEVEWTDQTAGLYQSHVVAGAEASLVLAFSGYSTSVTLTGNARFDGEGANVGGRGVIPSNFGGKLVASGATDGSALTIEIENDEAILS